MGEARRKGNFEERKAQAVQAGRVKGGATFSLKAAATARQLGTILTPEILLSLLQGSNRASRRRR